MKSDELRCGWISVQQLVKVCTAERTSVHKRVVNSELVKLTIKDTAWAVRAFSGSPAMNTASDALIS